jgi:hypothetical protein
MSRDNVGNQARYRARQKAENPEEYMAYRRELQRQWRLQNPEKIAAHTAVRRAVERGELVRADNCERCGKACKTEASHSDYTQVLDVEWLCRQCHAAKDARPKVAK